MPRLSIIAGFCVLTVLGLAVFSAEARVTVRSIDDLRADPKVAALEQRFTTFAGMAPAFSKCADPLRISQELKNYHKTGWEQATKDYTAAYYTSYLEKTGAPPPQKIIDYYMQFVSNEQQAQIQKADAIITRSSCKEMRNPLVQFEKMQRDDASAAHTGKTKKTAYDPWAPMPVQAPVATPATAALSSTPQPATP